MNRFRTASARSKRSRKIQVCLCVVYSTIYGWVGLREKLWTLLALQEAKVSWEISSVRITRLIKVYESKLSNSSLVSEYMAMDIECTFKWNQDIYDRNSMSEQFKLLCVIKSSFLCKNYKSLRSLMIVKKFM